MRWDFSDLPIGENGLDETVVEDIWQSFSASFDRKGLQELREEQTIVIEKAKHSLAGTVITEHKKPVAMVLPMEFSKVALALVHLAENARARAALVEAKSAAGGKSAGKTLEELWKQELGEDMPDGAGVNSLASG